MDRRSYKSKPFHTVQDARSNEVKKLVFPSNVEIGNPDIEADLTVYGAVYANGYYNLDGSSTTSGGGSSSGSFTGSLTRTLVGTPFITVPANNVITISTGSNGQIILSGTGGSSVGGSGAPTTAQYLTLATDGSLSAERVFTPGTGLKGTDGGANGAYTLAVNDSIVATLSGSTFSGKVTFVANGGATGSITVTSAGTPFITAPANNVITISTGSNGQIVLSGSGASIMLGGDLSGTTQASTVTKINGATVPASATLAQGDLLYCSTTATWSRLAAGTSGQFLKTQGPAANPAWANVSVPVSLLTFVAGVMTTSISGTWTRIGGDIIDMTRYPSTMNGLTRSITFEADIQKTSGATSAEIKLVDITDGVDVTNTDMTSSLTTATYVTSSVLTVGSSAGNIRSDSAKQYEVQLKMNGGTSGVDSAICTSARLAFSYN